MFGKNEVADVDHRADGSLLVNSIFYTIQGEGPDAGCPAIFLRLAHCNLRCYFCDTDFASGERMSVDDVDVKILTLAQEHACSLVVITGGEPLLQNVCPLMDLLNSCGVAVSIETAGTVWLPGLETRVPGLNARRTWKGNQIICSPKTPKLNTVLASNVTALKYVVRAGEISDIDGLPLKSTQLQGEDATIYRPTPILKATVPIFLQPMDEGEPEANQRNAVAAAAACMKYGYRLSMQLHKQVGLP